MKRPAQTLRQVFILLSLSCSLVGSLALAAQTTPSDSVERHPELQEKSQLIQGILEHPDFGAKQQKQGWRLKQWQDKQQRAEKFPSWLIWLFELIESNQSGMLTISRGIKLLLSLLLLFAAVYLVYRYRLQLQRLYRSLSSRSEPKVLPSSMFGVATEADTLPADIPAHARSAWQAGQHRAALSLLLRGSLLKLLQDFDCEFFASDTERECVTRVTQTAPALQSHFLSRLVEQWLRLAYAKQAPQADEFDALCEQWQEVF